MRSEKGVERWGEMGRLGRQEQVLNVAIDRSRSLWESGVRWGI